MQNNTGNKCSLISGKSTDLGMRPCKDKYHAYISNSQIVLKITSVWDNGVNSMDNKRHPLRWAFKNK